MNHPLKIAVIGGGAAGFFSAVTAKRNFPEAEVTIYEKSQKVLSKVKISGGGRCNVTNHCFDTDELAKNYPRGEQFLRKAFKQFSVQDTIDWYESRGVKLVTLPDNCMFPRSDSSQTIIDCLMEEAIQLNVEIKIQMPILGMEKKADYFELTTATEKITADRVILTVGGIPKRSGMEWILKAGCEMINPVPSLFTFNMPNHPVTELMGVVVEQTESKIEREKLVANGPLLVTHWGMSGPSVLKLSAWGARLLAERNYEFNLLVNWVNGKKEEEIRAMLQSLAQGEHGAKKVGNLNPFGISRRMWQFICDRLGFSEELRWNELGKKNLNKLVNQLINDTYPVSGKTTFKEEFVTAGGVALKQVDVNTMQHKQMEGLFFAGEVLDIDGITGGFNFQAAWTTGFIAGKHVGK
ncbi:MAG: NAD(P)/FAD-dependent oxidoreductase [Flavobacteriia bacterium]|nr:NAD(P)/FAD-dependent oxidoreductase [Flavobacteriia bacterium]OJX39263.1 MAG: flavoprotein [Flavobacteriia bacterium 40-80]